MRHCDGDWPRMAWKPHVGRFQRDIGEVAEMLDRSGKPLIVSHQRFEEAFGAHPTEHESALERTLAWYRGNPGWA